MQVDGCVGAKLIPVTMTDVESSSYLTVTMHRRKSMVP